MKAKTKQTSKTAKKTTKRRPHAQAKTMRIVVRPKRSPKRKKAAKPAFRFLCDCMMGLTAALIMASCFHLSTARDTRVLGLSTKLDKQAILQVINQERAAAGLNPLNSDDRLESAATAKGENMFADNYWAHVNPTNGTEPWAYIQQAGYEYQSAGENLGRDFSDEKSLVKAWMESPSHRANILNPQFSDVGLVVLDGEIDGAPVVLIVNLFAQPKSGHGQISQVATYNQEDSDFVLAGQVGPADAFVPRQRLLAWWQWVLAGVTGMGITMVLGKIRPCRARHHSRKKVHVI